MIQATKTSKEITEGQGYIVIPDVISALEATEARSRVLELADEERQQGKLSTIGKCERVFGLIYKGEIFESLVQHPIVLSILAEILGEDMTLGGFSAHILQPGATPMGLHVDYPYFTFTPPFPKEPVMQIQVIWMVEDFGENNGAPLFGVGTQTFASAPKQAEFEPIAQKVTGKAGSVVISHGLTWHNTSCNETPKPRVSLLGNYSLNIIRPIEDPSVDFRQEVLDRATPELKRLLGHNFFEDIVARGMKLVEQSDSPHLTP